MRVLILHTIPPDPVPDGRRACEFDLSEQAANIASALPDPWIEGVQGQPGEILRMLEKHKPTVVFNLCEAPMGRPDLEAHAAALLEWSGVRFTGCGSQTLALCRRKDRTNAVLAAAGIPVPATIDPASPRFPCIVRPVDEDGSAALDHASVCDTQAELARHVNPEFLQEFLPGREFVVSVWGHRGPDFLSIAETQFQNGLRLITYAAKWHVESDDFVNSPLSYHTEIEPELRSALTRIAQAVWRAVGARHAIRVDLRLDAGGVPRVLDVNPNPEIGPGVGICRAVQEAGWTWADFVRSLAEWA